MLSYPLYADLRYRRFYIAPVIAISVMAVIFRLAADPSSPADIALGLLPALAALAVSLGTREALGTGDAAVIGGMGVMLGCRQTLGICFFGLMISGAAGLFLIAAGKAGRKTQIPFVPFLTGAFICFWIMEKTAG